MDEFKQDELIAAIQDLAHAQHRIADEAETSNRIAYQMMLAQQQTLASSAALEQMLTGAESN
jgi:hypothetical protein